jgi:hypothetical protein
VAGTRHLLCQEQKPAKKFSFPFRRKNPARAKEKQRKLFCWLASVSERRRDGFLWSGIFDKVSSSEVIKILQDCKFRFLTNESVGGTKCRPLVFPRQILSARRAQARLAVGQDEVRNPMQFYICLPDKKNFCYNQLAFNFSGRLF